MKNFLLSLLILFCVVQLTAQELVRLSGPREAWLTNDPDRAIKSLEPAAADTSIDHITLYNLGYLYHLQKNNNKALTYLQSALQKNPDYPYTYLIAAHISNNMGNSIGAVSQLKRGLALDANNYDLLLELALTYKRRGNTAEAEKLLIRLIEIDEDKIEPRVELASIYRKQGNYEQALTVLEENANIFPVSGFLIEKSNLFRAMGKNKEAADLLRILCRDYPRAGELQSYRDSLRLNYGIDECEPDTAEINYRYKIKADEALDYKVSYSLFTLGWLKVRMQPAVELKGRMVYPIIFFVDTNPSYEFIISLHHIYESYIDAQTMNAIKSRLHTPGNEVYLTRMYYFNYEVNNFTAAIIYADGRYGRIEKNLPSRAQDGTSMLYFARGVVSNDSDGTTTVVIDEEYKYGHIKFLNETDEVEVGDTEIDAVKIFARAEFKGVAGMNGDAWGWFTPDDQSIPLVGKIEIIVGSITMEIEDSMEDILTPANKGN